MLNSHFAAVEKSLLALSGVQDHSGHSLHKGTPREVFVRDFLEKHLGGVAAIGTGEIIDQDSRPNEQRNQHDVVIYRKEFPKLDFQGGVSAFLSESVVATVEVKSTLDESALRAAFQSAMRCKNLKRNYFEGLNLWHTPPGIQNFIVAYKGPKKMDTIYHWIKDLEKEFGITYPEISSDINERIKYKSHSLDGIFVLGAGYIHFDNFPISFFNPETRIQNPWARWIFGESKSNNLGLLFLNLAQTVCAYPQKAVMLVPYLKEVESHRRGFGE